MGLYTQYDILEPVWRSTAVTAWLRIFDALYMRARTNGLYGDQRGSACRARVGSVKRGTSKFVPGLPINAYDNEWLNSQAYPEDTIRPGPPMPYLHHAKTIE